MPVRHIRRVTALAYSPEFTHADPNEINPKVVEIVCERLWKADLETIILRTLDAMATARNDIPAWAAAAAAGRRHISEHLNVVAGALELLRKDRNVDPLLKRTLTNAARQARRVSKDYEGSSLDIEAFSNNGIPFQIVDGTPIRINSTTNAWAADKV